MEEPANPNINLHYTFCVQQYLEQILAVEKLLKIVKNSGNC